MYSLACLPSSVSSCDGLAQDVPGRVVGQAEVLDEPFGLRALPGPGGPSRTRLQLAHLRKPS